MVGGLQCECFDSWLMSYKLSIYWVPACTKDEAQSCQRFWCYWLTIHQPFTSLYYFYLCKLYFRGWVSRSRIWPKRKLRRLDCENRGDRKWFSFLPMRMDQQNSHVEREWVASCSNTNVVSRVKSLTSRTSCPTGSKSDLWTSCLHCLCLCPPDAASRSLSGCHIEWDRVTIIVLYPQISNIETVASSILFVRQMLLNKANKF